LLGISVATCRRRCTELQRIEASRYLDKWFDDTFRLLPERKRRLPYQGAEFLFIGIDELTHFTLKQWQFLTSRQPLPGAK